MSTTSLPRRPSAVPISAEYIPDDLKDLRQWTIWRFSEEPNDRGKFRKIPYQASTPSRPAKINDPHTWDTYSVAIGAYQQGQADGLNFALTEDDPFIVLDADHCTTWAEDEPDTLVIAPDARETMEALGGYVELSPSGRGLHCWVRGAKTVCRSNATLDGLSYELYERGHFMSLTGSIVDGSPFSIPDRQQALDHLCRRLWPNEPSRVYLDAKATYRRGTVSVDAALSDRELERLILADDEADTFEQFNASERLRAIEEMLIEVDRIAKKPGIPSTSDRFYAGWVDAAAMVKARIDLPELAIELGFILTPANRQRTDWHGPCPVCGGTDRWQVFNRGDGWRTWCRQCEWTADAISLVRSYVPGCEHFRDAVTYLAQREGVA